MNPLVGEVALGVYAVLLVVGGVIGYVRAGSRPSLIAGVASAVLTISCLLVAIYKRPGLGLGLAMPVAALLLAIFGYRLFKGWKLMPAGLMTALSLIVLVLLGAYLLT